MIGGLGICGRELCCASYLEDFQPVSINMAKDQNLSLNPAKISGTCGRLMCCLKYEHEVYSELQKVTPKTDSLVETPEGRGTVLSTQMLRGTCKVQLEDAPDEPRVFACTDCQMIRSSRAKKNNNNNTGNNHGGECCQNCAKQQKQPEIDPMQEQEPVAVAQPPVRPRNEKPRRVKAAPQSTEDKPAAPARKPRREAPDGSDRPRLVKAAPPKDAVEQPAQEAGENTESGEVVRRRRRRGGAKRRRSSGEGNSTPSAE